MNLFSNKKIGNGAHAIHKQSALNRFGKDPVFDWVCIITINTAIGICMVYVAAALFLGVQDESDIAGANTITTTRPIISVADISKLVESYSSRHSDIQNLQHLPYSGSIDPSL